MDTLIGYLATMEEVTQDSGESIGNSMKTILSRMTQVKNSALEDGTTLNDVEKSLKNVGISLTDDSGEFRSMSDVLGDVSEKWDSLSNVEQSNIATTIAGVRQKEKFLLTSFTRSCYTESFNTQGVKHDFKTNSYPT